MTAALQGGNTSQSDEAYAAAWDASKDAGWNPAQLRSMGYAKPPAARRSTPATVATHLGAADSHHVA